TPSTSGGRSAMQPWWWTARRSFRCPPGNRSSCGRRRWSSSSSRFQGTVTTKPCATSCTGARRPVIAANHDAGWIVYVLSQATKTMICKRVHYQGRVQGVGFRYTAQRIAGGFRVAGYVKNLRDGSVELVAEGEPDQVEAFVAAVAERMADYITRSTVSDEP